MGDFNKDFNNDFNSKEIMTKEQIVALIAEKIAGQGNQVDTGSSLPAILNGIIGLIDAGASNIGNMTDLQTAAKNTIVAAINEVLNAIPSGPLMIQSAGNTTAGSYQVPALTVEQVQQAYNAVVSGRGCIIVDHDETMHAYVNQADQLNDELSIGILFYSSLVLTYTISSDAVVITYVELQPTE